MNQFSDIKLNMSNFSSNNNLIAIIQNQLNQLIKWVIIRALVIQFNVNSESSGSLESQRESGQNEFDEWDSSKSNFCSRNISYFDSNFDTDFIKIHDDKQIYHNVFSFTNWVWIKMIMMNAAVLQKSLKSCLLDKTDHWYTEKLSHLTKVDLQNDNKDIEEWCKTLKTKFCDLFSCALSALELLCYTINNIQC